MSFFEPDLTPETKSSGKVIAASDLLSIIPDFLDGMLPGGWKLSYNTNPDLLKSGQTGNSRNFAEILGKTMLSCGVPLERMTLLETGLCDQGNPLNHVGIIIDLDGNDAIFYHHRGKVLGHEVVRLHGAGDLLKRLNGDGTDGVNVGDYIGDGTDGGVSREDYFFQFYNRKPSLN